ncbi:MAG: putative metallopeptidase [Patescibacteria group bacterium]
MDLEHDLASLNRVAFILGKISMPHIKKEAVYCVKSRGATTRAIARIYSFPRVWQLALGISPKYVIEVISERFDKLKPEDKDRVLIHELMHIPKTFSGALVPHKCFGKKRICAKTVEARYQEFLKNCYE